MEYSRKKQFICVISVIICCYDGWFIIRYCSPSLTMSNLQIKFYHRYCVYERKRNVPISMAWYSSGFQASARSFGMCPHWIKGGNYTVSSFKKSSVLFIGKAKLHRDKSSFGWFTLQITMARARPDQNRKSIPLPKVSHVGAKTQGPGPFATAFPHT